MPIYVTHTLHVERYFRSSRHICLSVPSSSTEDLQQPRFDILESVQQNWVSMACLCSIIVAADTTQTDARMRLPTWLFPRHAASRFSAQWQTRLTSPAHSLHHGPGSRKAHTAGTHQERRTRQQKMYRLRQSQPAVGFSQVSFHLTVHSVLRCKPLLP